MGLFNRKIFNAPNKAFGIDISDLSIKVVELSEGGNRRSLSGFGLYPIPRGSVVNGDIINKDDVILSIRKAIEISGPKRIKSRRVVFALPETKAFLRIINIPKMEEDEISNAIKWEIEANIPLPIDQVYYDWRVLDKPLGTAGDNKLSILVVAVSRQAADQFIEVMEAAGLTVMGLEVESLAQARSLIEEGTGNDETTVIIDLGDRAAGFIAVLGRTPCFTSNIPTSIQLITDAISKGLGVSPEEAMRIKDNVGIGSFLKQDPVFEAVRPVLDGLVLGIKNSVDFYLTGLKYSNKIDRVLFCGGGASIKGLIPYLSSRLELEVVPGDPWVNFHQGKILPAVEKSESVRYSTAIGLALRGLSPYEDVY
ncbi:type IV pilus assembly protein PilM [Patescibacteria group bacterium]|nr:MAG: type IV pilus assembly protein PilM [Patescibacteria group bacterium]